MWKNYLKTTVRNLLRYKGYSFITVFGLTVGLATSIFIMLWVMDELSYDKFHTDHGRIYRVMSNFTYSDGKLVTGWTTPMKLAEAMQAEVPEIEHVMRMSWDQGRLFRYGEKAFYETGYYADSTLFKIFTFPIIHGDPYNPLPDVHSVAVSEKLAKKYLEDENPIGKVFRFSESLDLKITAVFADIPENSSLKFDFILPFGVYEKERPTQQNWGNSNIQTFASLRPGTELAQANEKIKSIVKKHCDDCISEPFLFPYTDLRLHAEFDNGKSIGGRIDYVIAFSLVAVIILLVACINFMNLATARSATRSREVGIRKVVGAQRSGLILQFIGESILLSFIALVFALLLVQLFLPFFSTLTGKLIGLDFQDPVFVSGLLGITLFCGLVAGSYPAFFLASFRPVVVLKGIAQSALSGNGLRKTLVVIQFAVSVVLIAGSMVVYSQISYIRNKHLGFDKENIILLDQFGGVYQNQQAYKNELLRYPAIKSVGISSDNPFSVGSTTTDPVWPGKPDGAEIPFKVILCDQHFIPTMGIELLEGRNFSDNYKQDSTNYMINERAMEAMGLTLENVIGTGLDMWMGKGQIIGLVKDFNNGNLREAIEPLIFTYSPEDTWRIFVKVEGNIAEALAYMQQVQEKYDPGYPFEYDFLDEKFYKEYENEAMIGKLSQSFTVVAIIISCLGLFGLATFTAERRTKELGIRKVMGASATSLIILLCSDFTRLVVLGLVIGIPIAWYLGSEYLAGYAFHAELNAWMFVVTAVTVIGIAVLTVVYQAAKAAVANPVESLRSE